MYGSCSSVRSRRGPPAPARRHSRSGSACRRFGSSRRAGSRRPRPAPSGAGRRRRQSLWQMQWALLWPHVPSRRPLPRSHVVQSSIHRALPLLKPTSRWPPSHLHVAPHPRLLPLLQVDVAAVRAIVRPRLVLRAGAGAGGGRGGQRRAGLWLAVIKLKDAMPLQLVLHGRHRVV